jgi:putative endonuclease
MTRGGTVYIMTNKSFTVYYVGVTSDLLSRVMQHKEKKFPHSFTAQYNADILVYYEAYSGIKEAITREKQLKKYSRMKKRTLINKMNPEWKDLFEEIKGW